MVNALCSQSPKIFMLKAKCLEFKILLLSSKGLVLNWKLYRVDMKYGTLFVFSPADSNWRPSLFPSQDETGRDELSRSLPLCSVCGPWISSAGHHLRTSRGQSISDPTQTYRIRICILTSWSADLCACGQLRSTGLLTLFARPKYIPIFDRHKNKAPR